MANGFVISRSTFTASNALTVATGTTMAVTAGNLLVGAITGNQNTTAVITDTSGNNWTPIGSLKFNSSPAVLFGLAYSKNCLGGGAVTFTCTYGTSSANRGIYVAQYSGVTTAMDPLTNFSFPTNGIVAAPGTGTDAISSGAVTPITAPCLIWSFSQDINGTAIPGAGTGFSGNGAVWANTAQGEDLIYSPAGAPSAQTATFTAGGSDGAATFSVGMAQFILAMPDMTSRGICVGA